MPPSTSALAAYMITEKLIDGRGHQAALNLVEYSRGGRRHALIDVRSSCLHVVALVIAVVELIVAPSLWRKTTHGLTHRPAVGV